MNNIKAKLSFWRKKKCNNNKDTVMTMILFSKIMKWIQETSKVMLILFAWAGFCLCWHADIRIKFNRLTVNVFKCCTFIVNIKASGWFDATFFLLKLDEVTQKM